MATIEPIPSEEKRPLCCDCGGWDVEWMYQCHTHKVEYCRGCSCPYCEEDDLNDGDCWEQDDE
jgi:hypothetical protein